MGSANVVVKPRREGMMTRPRNATQRPAVKAGLVPEKPRDEIRAERLAKNEAKRKAAEHKAEEADQFQERKKHLLSELAKIQALEAATAIPSSEARAVKDVPDYSKKSRAEGARLSWRSSTLCPLG
jgi:hypothetical protein